MKTCNTIVICYIINMRQIKHNLVQVRMSTGELAVLDDLAEKIYGGAGRSDVIRRVISERFNKAFPMYLRGKVFNGPVGVSEEELTDEQFCEKWGGKVVNSEAGKMCQLQSGGSLLKMLISDRTSIEKNAKKIQAFKKR